MMTDKIPSFKEQIDEIHVPMEKLDDIIFKTVQEHAPVRKKSWKSKLVYSASAAVVAFGLLVGSATVSPVMADFVSKIPVIGSIFSESNDPGLAQVSDLGFTQIIGEAKKVDDKILTIEEAFYDGVRLSVSYSLTSETPIENSYFALGPSFKIDGQAINDNYEYSTSHAINDRTSTHHSGIFEIEIEKELSDQFKLDLIFGGKDGKRWDFTIPVHTKTDVEIIKLNHKQQVAGIDLTLIELSSGLSGLKLNYETSSSEEDRLHATSLLFYIEDDLGNEVAIHSGGSTGTDKKQKGSLLFDPVNEHAKEITITPYFTFPGEDEDVKKLIKEFENEVFESFTVELPN